MGLVFFVKDPSLFEFVFYWLIGNVLSFLMALSVLTKKSLGSGISFKDMKKLFILFFCRTKFLKPAFKVAKKYFLSSLSFRTATVCDKLLLNHFFGKEIVAVYTLASTLSSCVLLFCEAFYIQRKAFSWISKFKSGDVKSFIVLLNQSKRNLATLAMIASFSSLLSCCILNVFLKLPILQNITTYFFLSISSFFASISLVDYYFLFAKKQDSKIFQFNMISSFVGLVFLIVLTPFFGPAACAFAFFVMSLLNFYLRNQETTKWMPENLGLLR